MRTRRSRTRQARRFAVGGTNVPLSADLAGSAPHPSDSRRHLSSRLAVLALAEREVSLVRSTRSRPTGAEPARTSRANGGRCGCTRPWKAPFKCRPPPTGPVAYRGQACSVNHHKSKLYEEQI